MFVCVNACLCRFDWLACQGIWLQPPIPWRISKSGTSRASAWQRGRGPNITAKAGSVCVCVRTNMCLVHVSSNEMSDSTRPGGPERLWSPKTVFGATPKIDPAAVFTVIKRTVGEPAHGPKDEESRKRRSRKKQVRETGYPFFQDLMAKNRIIIDLCVVMHWDRYAQVHQHTRTHTCHCFCVIFQQQKGVVTI